MQTLITSVSRDTFLHFVDWPAYDWFYSKAPCRWQGRMHLEFRDVPFGSLLPAGSWKHPDGVARWLHSMRKGRRIPPPVVCRTARGNYYLFDGNHRQEAMQEYLGFSSDDVPIRVAVLVPNLGYEFQFRYFDTYGTYVLVPRKRVITPTRAPKPQPNRLPQWAGERVLPSFA